MHHISLLFSSFLFIRGKPLSLPLSYYSPPSFCFSIIIVFTPLFISTLYPFVLSFSFYRLSSVSVYVSIHRLFLSIFPCLLSANQCFFSLSIFLFFACLYGFCVCFCLSLSVCQSMCFLMSAAAVLSFVCLYVCLFLPLLSVSLSLPFTAASTTGDSQDSATHRITTWSKLGSRSLPYIFYK